MSTILNIIFFVSMYPVIFLLYYNFKSEGKQKRNMLFGIQTSKNWISQEECDAIQYEYRRKMNRYLLIFVLIPFITLLIPYTSIAITVWMIWLMAAIVAFQLPFALNNKRLKQLKQERCGIKTDSNIIYPEIKPAGNIRALKKTDFLLPNLLCIGIVVFSLFCLHDERFELYSFRLRQFLLPQLFVMTE